MHHFLQTPYTYQSDKMYKHLHQYQLWLQPSHTYQQHMNESKLSKLCLQVSTYQQDS